MGGYKAKTHDQFISEVKSLVGDEYAVLGEYIRGTMKLEIIHNNCGNSYMVQPRKILEGSKCPYCSREKSKKTNVEFIAQVKSLVGDEYVFLQEYKGNHHKVMVLHTECSFEYPVTPSHFINGNRCPRCGKLSSAKARKYDDGTFKEKLREKHGDSLISLTKYVGSAEPIKFKCNICEHVFWRAPASQLQNRKCPACTKERLIKTRTKTHEEFSNEMKEKFGSKFELLSEYLGSHKYVSIKHTECGLIRNVTPTQILTNGGCPKCSESKGEKRVFKVLSQRGINFKSQYRNNNCRYKRTLPFDFAILCDKNKVISLIEYDGEQHFNSTAFGGKGFAAVQRNDAIKTKYCTDNGIPLIRIPYWKFNEIDEILSQELLPLLRKNKAS